MYRKIAIQNLKCGGCKNQIESELLKLKGVLMVVVDEQDQEVLLSLEADSEIENLVIKRLKQMGYPPSSDPNSFLMKSKSYLSCALGRSKK